jgi:hypothetical protein
MATDPQLLLGGAGGPAEEEETPQGGLLGRAGEALGLRGEEEEAPTEDVGQQLIGVGTQRLLAAEERQTAIKDIFEAQPPVQEEPTGKYAFSIPTAQPENGFGVTDVANFLLGDEMALLGIKLDKEGFDWSLDHVVDQWAEEPLWLNLLTAGGLAASFATGGVPMLLRASAASARAAKGITKADEIAELKNLGYLDETKNVNNVTNAQLHKLRISKENVTKYQRVQDMLAKEARGELELNPIQKTKFWFEKNFNNGYMKKINGIGETGELSRNYKNSLHNYFKEEDIGRLMLNLPGPEDGLAYYKYMAKKASPGLAFTTPRLAPEVQRHADMMYDLLAARQKKLWETGIISDETYERFPVHIPALHPKTPKPEMGTQTVVVPIQKGESILLQVNETPRLDSVSLSHRKKGYGEAVEKAISGEIITDPADLHMRGYTMAGLLDFNYNFVADAAEQYGMKGRDVLAMYGSREAAAKAGLVSLNQASGNVTEVLRRVLKKRGFDLTDDEELPYLSRTMWDELFGESGLFQQQDNAHKIMDALQAHVAFHKTMKTAMSPATHGQNILGGLAFMSQAGMNPFTPENAGLMQGVTKALWRWAGHVKEQSREGFHIREMIDPKTGKLKGLKLGKIKYKGTTLDLDEEFLDPMMREIIEESAFANAEAFGNLSDMLSRMEKGSLTRKGLQGFLKFVNSNKVTQKTFDTMTSAYLAEDMAVKLAYGLFLRQQGFSKMATALEIGRRFPMYSTLGKKLASSRRIVLPWVSFPAEAMRITKNNLMDHPMRMAPWLMAPGIMSSGLATIGAGPASAEEAELRKRELPTWAQTPFTVVSEGERGAKATAAIAGAGLGAVPGMIAGGAAGAVAGAGLGALAAQASLAFEDEERLSKTLRGAILNWLPHSAFTVASTSPEFDWNLQGWMQQLPAEPLAILRPLIETMSGRTGFGQPLGGEDTLDELGKVTAGYIGFMAPPFFQKYGFKTTSPDQSLSGAITGKHMPGDITNVSRFLTDLNISQDPRRPNPGSPTFDFLLNNFSWWRSYELYPELQLQNEQRKQQAHEKVLSTYSRNLKYYTENRNEEKVKGILGKVMETYVAMYPDQPELAQQKFAEYIGRFSQSFGGFVSGLSQEEIQYRMAKAHEFAKNARGNSRKVYVGHQNALLRESAIRD